MEASQFASELLRDGFSQAIVGSYVPGRRSADHHHPFEVRGLVLSGEMEISSTTASRHYRSGEVFVMRLGETHREVVGGEGCCYLYGTRGD